MPKVSVIIPNYNHEFFLKQRIESVLNQTYNDFEIILLDDCSSDNSSKILKEYSNHSVVSHLHLNNKNSGSVFKQWIKGIELAKGDFVWIAESDDWASPHFIEETIKVFQENDDVGVVFTDSIKVNTEDKEIGVVSSQKEVFKDLCKENNRISVENLGEFLLEKLVILNASSVLFRKATFSEVNFDKLTTFKNLGDVFTYISIAIKYDIIFIPKQLNYLREFPERTTNLNFKNGILHYEKLDLLNYYLNTFYELNLNKNNVNNYFINLFLPCLNFKYWNGLKEIIKKMKAYKYITQWRYCVLFFTITLDQYVFLGKMPFFIKAQIKKCIL